MKASASRISSLMMTNAVTLVTFFVVMLSLDAIGTLVEAQEVAICGGFVSTSSPLKSSSGSSNADFSSIKIKLKTAVGGVQKDESECAPTGYYSIPVYDKGSFVLEVEGPAGWSFEPSSVPVTIGADNVCNGGQDINFVITGFKVSGNVKTLAATSMAAGASGVNIKLRSKSTGITAETVSSNGRYQFDNVVPGSYVLEASHPHWFLSFSSSSGSSSSSISTEFAWKWDNTIVPQTISVTGYDINGKVTSETGEPLSGVNFLLYSPSSSSKTLPCVGDSSPSVEGDSTLYPEGRPLCISKSKEGKFRFENVPAGDYRVVPFFKGTHTNFDLFPKEVKVAVQDTISLSDAFKVIGFSVVGKVVDARGRGVADASILVNGQQKTKTIADGTYRLERMTSGDYTIETQKSHVFFSTLANFRVSPTAPQLPDIVANAYHLCGKVVVDQPLNGISPTKSRTILVKNLGSRSPAKSVQTESGNFCAVVTPGKYSVSVQLTSDELAAGLLLKPSEHNVTIQADPILDLEFRQSLLKITGSVRCLQSPCHPSLYVTLSAIDRNYQVTTGIVGDNFTFREVTPGRYRLSTNLESWCWQGENSVELQVTDSDLAGISFTQSGYQISIDSTQTTQLTYALASSPTSSTPLEVKRGINKICLSQPGVYDFTPSQSCFKFEREVYRYDTTTGGKIDLVATHYSLRGTVSVTGVTEKQAAAKDLISVRVKRIRNGVEVDTSNSFLAELPTTLDKKTDGAFVFDYKFWAVFGEELRFFPSSSLLLFYPSHVDASVISDSCPPPVTLFVARPGLFLKGKVTPAVGNTLIRVLNEANEVLIETVTKEDGTYAAGPLYDDKKYQVTAERENYKFVTADDKGLNFLGKKLGSIKVTLQDQDTKEALQGVLVSLSGGDGYRSNSMTQQGAISFSNLYPGSYFLRLALKEYSFIPPTKSVQVEDGEDVVVAFQAKRVAFSAYGSVKTLNGEPEKSVTLEALGPNGEREETQSDSAGNFRIRGLVPTSEDSHYTVRVKTHPESKVERASPLGIQVKVQRQDVQNLNFLVFRKSAESSISGVVNVNKRDLLDKLQIELYSLGEGNVDDTPIKTLQLGPSNFFDFRGLPVSSVSSRKYTLKLKSTLSNDLYAYTLPSVVVEVPADETNVDVSIDFKAEPHTVHQELTSTPFWALLFGVLPVLCSIYRAELMVFIQKVMEGRAFERESRDTISPGAIDPDLLYHHKLHKQSKKTTRTGSRR